MSYKYPIYIAAVFFTWACMSNEDYKEQIRSHDAKGKSMHDKRKRELAFAKLRKEHFSEHREALQKLADKGEYMTGFSAKVR